MVPWGPELTSQPTPGQRCWQPPGWRVLCTGKMPGTMEASITRAGGCCIAASLVKCRCLGPGPGRASQNVRWWGPGTSASNELAGGLLFTLKTEDLWPQQDEGKKDVFTCSSWSRTRPSTAGCQGRRQALGTLAVVSLSLHKKVIIIESTLWLCWYKYKYAPAWVIFMSFF